MNHFGIRALEIYMTSNNEAIQRAIPNYFTMKNIGPRKLQKYLKQSFSDMFYCHMSRVFFFVPKHKLKKTALSESGPPYPTRDPLHHLHSPVSLSVFILRGLVHFLNIVPFKIFNTVITPTYVHSNSMHTFSSRI